MGFGGFFNYDKPGPGIKKDGPQKKTIFVVFETWFRNLWKLCSVSMIYTLFTVLLIPNGLGAVGITNVARNLARDKHSFGISDFAETVKKNWKQALPAGIINLIIDLINGFAIYFYLFGNDVLTIIGFGISVAIFIFFRFMKYHLWLILITFKLPLKKMYKNCFLFALQEREFVSFLKLGIVATSGTEVNISFQNFSSFLNFSLFKYLFSDSI